MVWKRVVSAIVFGVIFLVALIWGRLPFTFAVAFAAVLGSVEMYSVVENRGDGVPSAAAVGIAGTLAFVFLAHYKGFASFGYVTMGIVFLSFLWYMFVLKHVRPTRAIAFTVLVPLLTGLCLSHLVLLRDLPVKRVWVVIIYVIVLIWVFDIFAYLIGRKVGRHKMIPRISPNKSWEGAIAGVVGVMAAAVVFRYAVLAVQKYDWLSIGVSLVIGALVCVLGPLGDLSESMIKREFGVKDMGRLIPEHGGIMDRFDSTLFVAPAVFYYLFYFVIR